MTRAARASGGGVCDHVLNRGNIRAVVFLKDGDYVAYLKAIGHACVETPTDEEAPGPASMDEFIDRVLSSLTVETARKVGRDAPAIRRSRTGGKSSSRHRRRNR